jgi:hypothetical protein
VTKDSDPGMFSTRVSHLPDDFVAQDSVDARAATNHVLDFLAGL